MQYETPVGGNERQWEAMGGNGRQWETMGGNGRQWEPAMQYETSVGGNERQWEAMGGSGRQWETVGDSHAVRDVGGRKWEAVGGNGRQWETVGDSGRQWETMGGSGRQWEAAMWCARICESVRRSYSGVIQWICDCVNSCLETLRCNGGTSLKELWRQEQLVKATSQYVPVAALVILIMITSTRHCHHTTITLPCSK